MYLTTLILTGLRSVDHSSVQLGDVTLFTGPNGAGKTAAVGAIAYALTGRFPGVPMTVPGLLTLANDPDKGFTVQLIGSDETIVERGIEIGSDGKASQKILVEHQNRRAEGKRAEAVINKLFGDVDWFIDAFDPERSIWRQSGEKRKEWALSLCAASSGWTIDRLTVEIGEKSEYWNGDLATDAGRCLDLNLANLYEKELGLRRLIKEAKVVADGVTVSDEVATIELRIRAAEQGLEQARRRWSDTDNAIRSVNER
jgi:energy-coupling factor transporter ATP-binding protein EcfA2